jgi:hypothetical protein
MQSGSLSHETLSSPKARTFVCLFQPQSLTPRKMSNRHPESICELDVMVHTPVIPALGRLRQEDCEFQDSLGDRAVSKPKQK